MQNNNKTRKTALNAFFSATSLLTSSLFGLIATRIFLRHIGSDYNGLNSTINNFLEVLLIVEGGFTLAALVKLYKPFGENDYTAVNAVVSKTKESLHKVGIWMLTLGVIGSALYSLIIKTELSYFAVFISFVLSVLSTTFNFSYAYKYRLLFQVSQTEYILYGITIGANTVAYLGMIWIVINTKNFVLARAFYALCHICSGFVIACVCKRKFPFARFDENTEGVQIEGTKELFVSRVAGLFYNSLTVFYISAVAGMVHMSIYAVYNQIITFVANFANIFLSSPRNSLGAVVSEGEGRFEKILREYEYVATLSSSIMFSTAVVLIVPFVRLYTANVADVNYIVPYIGLILAFTSIPDLIRIPSRQCIELTGRFKISRNCQTTALICLLLFSTVGAGLWGFVGVMIAKLATNLILSILEIGYTHTRIVPNTLKDFLTDLFPNFLFALLITTPEYLYLLNKTMSVWQFIGFGFGILIVNTSLILLFNLLFFRKNLAGVFARVKSLLRK